MKTYSKFFSRLCILALVVVSTLFAAPLRRLTYKEVAGHYLPSFGSFRETEYESSNIVFAMFATLDKPVTADTESAQEVGRDRALRDLQILSGDTKNPEKNLLSRVKRTQTVFGEAVLAHMLANPCADPEILEIQQSYIKQLVEDEQLYNQIKSALALVASKQEEVLQNWKSKKSLLADHRGSLFFADNALFGKYFDKFNDSKLALGLSNDFAVLKPIIQLLSLEVALDALTQGSFNSMYCAMENDPAAKRSWWYFIKKARVNLSPNTPLLNHDTTLYNSNDPKWADFSKKMKTLGWGGWFIQKFLMSGALYMQLSAQSAAVAKVHKRMISAARLFEGIQAIDALAARSSLVHQLLGSHYSSDRTAHLKELQNLLKSGIFADEAREESKTMLGQAYKTIASALPHHLGRILYSYRLMDRTRADLIPMLKSIGQLDAYMSIATLYKEMQGKRVAYAFPTYLKADKPRLLIKDMWNPFIPVLNVVTNDIDLGTVDSGVHMIVTGSNTGGKSTILKGAFLSAYLSQTLLIAPAQEMQFTPYSYFGTLMNVKDELGISKFKKELLIAKSIHQAIQELNDEFGLVIADEPFKSTGTANEIKILYEFITRMSQSAAFTGMFASNSVAEASTLEEKTNGQCRNYYIDAENDAARGISRAFKLKRGVSTVNIAQDLFREQFDQLEERPENPFEPQTISV